MYDFPEIDFLDRHLVSHDARAIRRLLKGPMRKDRPRFGVVRFEARDRALPDLLVTTALARGRRRRSFVCVSRKPTGHLIEVLTAIAWWHMQPTARELRPDTLIPVGRPWERDAPQTHVLVADPELFGARWAAVTLPEMSWDVLWTQPLGPDDIGAVQVDADGWLAARVVESGVHLAIAAPVVPEA